MYLNFIKITTFTGIMSKILTFQKTKKKITDGLSCFFIDSNFSLNGSDNLFTLVELKKIKSFLKKLKSLNNKDKNNFVFDLSESKKVIFVKIKKKTISLDLEQCGADFFDFSKLNHFNDIHLYSDNFNTINKNNSTNDFLNFVHGFNLKSYSFNKYRTQEKIYKMKLNVFNKNITLVEKNYFKYKCVESGVDLARDLVSEPPNFLNPKKYVEIIKKLSSLGINIVVYNELQMKKLGMNAILGVGQGSINESYLVTLEWKGNKNSKEKPLAFVGKGVCFDTGGISLKPAKFMEEMKYDMAGSAVVIGLLKTLASRKAKINAIGIVGLVENMPGGNAQRPGDIVKSFSGKTIEILNTDAEGRLVLADALSFAEKKFNPKIIVDLATLTGAIIISLGQEYAGLFSNNDLLANRIFETGHKVGEKVWRLPLDKNYNKLMDSTIADVQNINYSGGAGSITAAEFLQRFILNNTPWAHLDIAGMAFSKKAANLNPSGATGFGVRLLNKFCEEFYE